MIKVLVVEDSPTAREMIATILNSSDEIEVIGKVTNGREAINFLEEGNNTPDIITTDINMPIMNGFDMIEYIMAYFPLPILIVTVLEKDANFMRCLNLGALDIIQKPAANAWQELPQVGRELIEKVILLSKVQVVTHLSGKKNFPKEKKVKKCPDYSGKVVCLTSSTGGPNTLLELLKNLPGNFPAPVLVVQHMTESFFVNGMVEWFRSSLNLNVCKAENNMRLSPGTVYISPIGSHMLLQGNRIILSDAPPVNNQKPSADLLFESAAKSFGSEVIAIVLTGVGNDGARGIEFISKSGGKVFAQKESSCIVFGMPKAAIATNCVEKVLDVKDMPVELINSL